MSHTRSSSETARLYAGIFKERITAELSPIIQLKFPYNINPSQVTTEVTGSGTVTQENGMALASTGAATSSSATLYSRGAIAYQAGQGVTVRFSAVFDTPKEGNVQCIGLGDSNDGLFIGYNGLVFGTLRRRGGVDEWTTDADWNGDFKNQQFVSGDFNPQKGNIYQIQFQWLGFGNIVYSIFEPIQERYVIMNKIEYPNTETQPSILNPNLPVRIECDNTTNDTNVVLKSASMGAFIEGQTVKSSSRFAAEGSKTVTTEVSVLTIKNNDTFQSATNRATMFPDVLSVSSDGTKPVTFNLYINTTLGGTPSYTVIDADESVASFDVAGTTVTGGTKVLSIKIARDSGQTLKFSDLNIKLLPGDILTVSAQSALTSDVSVGMSWRELS